jgi:hypothetical protein
MADINQFNAIEIAEKINLWMTSPKVFASYIK